MTDFYKALKKQAELTPSPEFDRTFWAKFDGEFNQKVQKSGFSRFFGFDFSMPTFATLATAASLLISAGIFYRIHLSNLDIKSIVVQTEEVAALTQHDMLSHMEMLKTFESLPGGLPTSDEEWNVLLPEEVPAS